MPIVVPTSPCHEINDRPKFDVVGRIAHRYDGLTAMAGIVTSMIELM
jgi:hypothetical protein